jgi:alkylation response protein AidB-like acyl-CoA dehydrogenase
MTHDAAVLKTRDIARRVLAPFAGQNDKAGRFSTEAVESLRESGLVGLLLPVNVGGAGLGPRTFAAVTATLAETDASVAMVYLMHVLHHNYLGVYSAFIQVSEPVSLTDTSERKMCGACRRLCRGAPLRSAEDLPFCSLSTLR